MSRRAKTVKLSAFLIAGGLLLVSQAALGAAEKSTAQPPPAATPTQATAKPAEAAPPQGLPAAAPVAVQPPSIYEDTHYTGSLRRDPFKSLLILRQTERDVSKLPPIQQIELQSFKVVGIIMDAKKGNRAMVLAPDNRSYVISKGTIVGRNEGEVISIDGQGITVKEKFVDFMNRETFVTTVIKASEKQSK
jgi:type IV pilus assembly protein PilP